MHTANPQKFRERLTSWFSYLQITRACNPLRTSCTRECTGTIERLRCRMLSARFQRYRNWESSSCREWDYLVEELSLQTSFYERTWTVLKMGLTDSQSTTYRHHVEDPFRLFDASSRVRVFKSVFDLYGAPVDQSIGFVGVMIEHVISGCISHMQLWEFRELGHPVPVGFQLPVQDLKRWKYFFFEAREIKYTCNI